MTFRKFSYLLIVVGLLATGSSAEAYTRWEYRVNEPLTEQYIDLESTVADIDYDKQEIRLPPRPVPNTVQFASDGTIEYAVMTGNGVLSFVFDGEKIIENPLMSFSGLEDPVSFAISSAPFPTIYTAENRGTLIRQYRVGEGSPSLGITGLERVMSVTAYDTGEIAVLDKNNAQAYVSVDGTLMELPGLSISNITDPIAVATGSNYETVVLTQNEVKWFSFDGSELVENPFMSLAGVFEDPITITAANYSFAVLDQGKISLYEYSVSENMVVAVTELEDLNSPQGVALRPGTKDMVIIDQKGINKYDLRYFMFDGTEMIENPYLAQTVDSILKGSGYMEKGWIISKVTQTESGYANWLRVRANIELPEDTGITWYVTNTEDNWYPVWKAERSDGILSIYKFVDDDWVLYQGDLNDIYPQHDDDATFPPVVFEPDNEAKNLNQTLWIPLTEIQGNSIRWKAEMYTNNKEVTPKITTSNNLSVVWEANAMPFAPIINDPDDGLDPEYDDEHDTDIGDDDPQDYMLPRLERKDGWIYTTTPLISWAFQDSDGNDYQSAYQVRLIDRNKVNHENLGEIENIEGAIIYDSGKLMSSETSHKIGTSENPLYRGPMWETGGYQFAVQVRTWDKSGSPSPWSTPTLDILEADSFNVLAFERPRVVEIIDPPDEGGGSHGPIKDDPNTHEVIKEGTTAQELPKFRAGTWVTVRLDGVGPIDPGKVRAVFKYSVNDKKHVILQDQIEIEKTGEFGENQQFDFKFFTDAPIEDFPDGTVVEMYAGGESVEHIDAGKTILFLPPYADGVAISDSTAYETWYVVLQGSNK